MKQFLKRNWTLIIRITIAVILCWMITTGNFYVMASFLFFMFIGSEIDLVTSKSQTEHIKLLEERIDILNRATYPAHQKKQP